MEERLRTAVVCERTRVYVSLEVDGELSEFERGFLTTHLVRCSECRAYRNEIHAVANHIRDTPAEIPPRTVRVPLHRSSHPARRLARYQLGAAAALAVAVVGTASLVTPTIEKEPTISGTGLETLPTQRRDTNAFAPDELRKLRLTTDFGAFRPRNGVDFIL